MRVLISCFVIVLFMNSCGKPAQNSDLDAVKGVGIFKDGYLYALSSPKDPSDRCWYYNSVYKVPFTSSYDPQRDAAILKQASPLTISSVTSTFMAELLSTQLQMDRNNQALASGLATGACAVAGTVTIANPTAKIASVVLCTGIKETFFQVLKNSSDSAERASGGVDRLGQRNEKAIVTVPKDAINLFVNTLKNQSGDGNIDSCAEVKANLSDAEFNKMAGVR